MLTIDTYSELFQISASSSSFTGCDHHPSSCHLSAMSTQASKLFVVAVRSACCHPRARPTLKQPASPCSPRVLLQRRTFSLDSLSVGPGRPQPQQARTDRASPSSAPTHRNLSAVAVSVQVEIPVVFYGQVTMCP